MSLPRSSSTHRPASPRREPCGWFRVIDTVSFVSSATSLDANGGPSARDNHTAHAVGSPGKMCRSRVRAERGTPATLHAARRPRSRRTRLRNAPARAIRNGFLYCSTGRRKCGGLFVMQGGSPFHVFEAQTPARRWGAVDVGTGDAVERAAGAAFHAPNRIPRPPHRETTDGSRQGLSRSRTEDQRGLPH